jgi:hypothetical protein
MVLLPQSARAESSQWISLPWQLAVLAILFTAFYLRRILQWASGSAALQSQRVRGFVFAFTFALVVSPVLCGLVETRSLPRFNDIFLVGIVLATYLFTWEGGALLLVLSTLVSAWVLPPYGSFSVARGEDWYRLLSFVAISVFLIALVHRLKTRRGEGMLESPMDRSMAPAD